MYRSLVAVFALLCGTAFLQAGSGLQSLIMPLRGQIEGFSTTQLGLFGTAWAAGFVIGCMSAPRLVGRVGHIRAFGILSAFGAAVVLVSGIIVNPGHLDGAALFHRLHHGRRFHDYRELAERKGLK